MAVISIRGISVSYGGPLLLDDIEFSIEQGERVCLVGHNGAGKSTLLKLLSGALKPDAGEIKCPQEVQISRLEQEVPRNPTGDVFSAVAEGLGPAGNVAAAYRMAVNNNDMAEMERLQEEINNCDGWALEGQINTLLSRLSLDADSALSTLSGGLQRRVLLARALVNEPDLLLLDEPTNHLEVQAIEWLETFLLNFKATVLFITHDRSFLKKLATRIVEIDRGKLTSWPGDYDTYLVNKEKALEEEERHHALFDKKLAQEETWIRQGVKARRTRNEGRVRRLQQLRKEHQARRNKIGQAKMQLHSDAISGKVVLFAEQLNYQVGGKVILKDFSTTIVRGDKIGIIGPNGVGKTTLIKLLTGQLQPDSGEVELGTKLTIAYFDQLRGQLKDDKTVRENIADGNDTLSINGRDQHVISYLNDFLFTPDRANTPVKALSGGERNRLLLARLFSKPSNFLIMDEPTNDLDIETLEKLEELLADYKGTLLLISHDREFIDNVVSSTLVFEGDGVVNDYVGGYQDWLRQRPDIGSGSAKSSSSAVNKTLEKQVPKAQKLSYKKQRELDQLPGKVETLEAEIAAIQEQMSQSDFFKQDKSLISETQQKSDELEKSLEQAYARWEALEDEQ